MPDGCSAIGLERISATPLAEFVDVATVLDYFEIEYLDGHISYRYRFGREDMQKQR